MKKIAWIAFLFGVLVSAPSHADPIPASVARGSEIEMPKRLDVVLAQLCVNEADLHCDTSRDLELIYRVLVERAGSRAPARVRAMARAYSGRVWATDRATRPWIRHLGAVQRRPPVGWDRGPWQPSRARWQAILGRARAVLTAPDLPPNPCNGRPDDWGGTMDIDEYTKAWPAAVELECEDTHNAGFCLPHRGPCPENTDA